MKKRINKIIGTRFSFNKDVENISPQNVISDKEDYLLEKIEEDPIIEEKVEKEKPPVREDVSIEDQQELKELLKEYNKRSPLKKQNRKTKKGILTKKNDFTNFYLISGFSLLGVLMFLKKI